MDPAAGMDLVRPDAAELLWAVAGAAILFVGVPLWLWAISHIARHGDDDFQRAGVAPRTFWLITVVLLGPAWAAAYLLYVGPRLARVTEGGAGNDAIASDAP
jgi:hypothetical protein